jgi:hypothetical protein
MIKHPRLYQVQHSIRKLSSAARRTCVVSCGISTYELMIRGTRMVGNPAQIIKYRTHTVMKWTASRSPPVSKNLCLNCQKDADTIASNSPKPGQSKATSRSTAGALFSTRHRATARHHAEPYLPNSNFPYKSAPCRRSSCDQGRSRFDGWLCPTRRHLSNRSTCIVSLNQRLGAIKA